MRHAAQERMGHGGRGKSKSYYYYGQYSLRQSPSYDSPSRSCFWSYTVILSFFMCINHQLQVCCDCLQHEAVQTCAQRLFRCWSCIMGAWRVYNDMRLNGRGLTALCSRSSVAYLLSNARFCVCGCLAFRVKLVAESRRCRKGKIDAITEKLGATNDTNYKMKT